MSSQPSAEQRPSAQDIYLNRDHGERAAHTQRALVRLHVRMDIDPRAATELTLHIVRLMARLMPHAPRLIASGDDSITLRVRHGDISVVQSDQLVCRLARLAGVRNVRAEHQRVGEGVLYAARLRGRAAIG